MEGEVVGYLHLVNCEIMLELRGESDKSTGPIWEGHSDVDKM